MAIQTLGTTTNFVVKYDNSFPFAQAMAQALLGVPPVCESELAVLSGWFGLSNALGQPSGFGSGNRITVTIQSISSGAANNAGYQDDGSTYINIGPLANGTPGFLVPVTSMLFVNELVEILMSQRDPDRNSWDAGGSDGEGLSQFLGIMRFPTGHYQFYNSFTANWLSGPGVRPDYINNVENTDGNAESFGCALLFLFFLKDQLGFSPGEIVKAGGRTLGETYGNLTKDPGSPYGFFRFLVGLVFPVEQPIAAGIRQQQIDNPFPIFNFYFAANQNSFGKGEVKNSLANGAFNDSLRLVLEGCSPFMLTQFAFGTPATPSFPAGSKFAGTHFVQQPQLLFQNAALQRAPQQIEFVYNVDFDPSVLNDFTKAPINQELDSSISLTLPVTTARNSVAPQNLSAKIEISFYGAEDPFFVTFAPGKTNGFWVGEDLRVFSAIPGTQPVRGGPSLDNNSIPGAFEYCAEMIKYLSTTFGDPLGKDPFDPNSNIIPDQALALQSDSSVIPSTSFINQPGGSSVYNFAVARVRLDGALGTTTNGPVRVFFRMWSAATPDTVYNDTKNYNSHKDNLSLPDWPLPAPNTDTWPMFATSNSPNFQALDNPEYGSHGANSQVITINNLNGQQWAYFGCFLNVYDVNNLIGSESITQVLRGSHHCLVAQIAYDDAPIQQPPGVFPAPGNCDKLVQRNLSITLAYNPGLAPTNRIPHVFDVPPTDPAIVDEEVLFDELMIDWGQVPLGSIASIFWPGASAFNVVALADKRYAYHSITAVDANTIETEVIRGKTFIPIPVSSGPNLAGLFTVELTPVSKGNEYSVVVHRVSSGRIRVVRPPAIIKRGLGSNPEATALPSVLASQSPPSSHSPAPPPTLAPPVPFTELASIQQGLSIYRKITGAFQVTISVRADDEVLPFDEETLSIMKWRLSVMKPNDRWYPVIERYVEYLSLRVDGHGGDSEAVPPSVNGLGRRPCRRGSHGHGHGGGKRTDYECEKCRC